LDATRTRPTERVAGFGTSEIVRLGKVAESAGIVDFLGFALD